MPIRIGFVNFTALDPPAVDEYAAYKRLTRVLEPGGYVKSLAETHPPMRPWRFEPPALNRTPGDRIYKLAAELAPWMDEFHHRILDEARIRARLRFIEQTHFQNDMAEIKHYRQVDLLHAWITELLFERVYRRVGRNHQLFEKVAQHEWEENARWQEVHKDKRLEEAQRYPELHKKELVHPYRFEVKIPNDKKVLEAGQEHILQVRQLTQEAKMHAWQLQQVLHDMIFDEVRKELQRQHQAQHAHSEKRARWHLQDVLRAFEKAWIHAWNQRVAFRELVRRGIIEQAEVYPKLFRDALVDPFELEIREPNEKNHKQKIQEHLHEERQQQALVKLESEADRQLLKTTKIDLESYRAASAEQIEAKQQSRQWQEHVLIERRDQHAIEERDHRSDAKRVESQGYQLLAGRMIPQPRFGVDADIVTRVPLSMGLHGDPRAPEHITPTPLLMVPSEQRKNWQKLQLGREDELRHTVGNSSESWLHKAQGIRQNLAALDYAAQATREIERPQEQTLGTIPSQTASVPAPTRTEPIADVKASTSTDNSRSDPDWGGNKKGK